MFVAIPSPNFINSLKQRDFPTSMFRTISRDQRSPKRSAAISRVSSRFRVAFSILVAACFAANDGSLGSATLIGLLRPLAIPSQMRHDAEQALDDHQLSPVVNLMLLAADQHLEAAFVPWTGPSACYELDRPRFGELLDPIAPAFSPVAQHWPDLASRK